MKDKLVHVTDSELIAKIELNDFTAPIPAAKTVDGYWVYEWSLQQFRRWCLNVELGDEFGAKSLRPTES